MTNVTRKKTSSEAFIKAREELIRALRKDRRFAEKFVTNILTESEQIMLIKRFAAILMYQRGYSQYRVWNSLFISPTTAQRIYERYDRDDFPGITQTTKNETTSFLGLMADLINAQVSMKARRRLMERT